MDKQSGSVSPIAEEHVMTRSLQAIYEKGVLRPLEPLDLREQQRVTVAITDEAPEPTISYPPGFSSPEEWSKALREWAASHPRVEHFVDDSRESLYAGRGE
jgi:predicted DNA-binding antitoxin AbrB/MazE fold protein